MKKNNTIFSQMLQLISRYEFKKWSKAYETEKYSKGFSSWNHFVALLYAQIAGFDALRSIVNCFKVFACKLYHLGIKIVKRSTLSYANNKRNYRLFEKIFYHLLSKTLGKSPNHKFRFKNPLYSIDSTTIDLCLSLYNWAKFRKTKGGIKLHVKYNHAGYLPETIHVSKAIDNDQKHADKFNFNEGDIVVFDRGYENYSRYAFYCKERIYFVTRLQINAAYKVIKRNKVSKHENITSDQIIQFTNFYSKQDCPMPLRRIRSVDPETGKAIIILTNLFHLSCKTVATIYRERWQIELFFKTIKQNLKIKSFLGTSVNAVMSQIWVAAIAYLLLSYMKFLSTFNWTFQKLITVLRTMLFHRRDLWAWLNKPFDDIPQRIPIQYQLELL